MTTQATTTLFVHPYLHNGRWFAIVFSSGRAPVLTPDFGTQDALNDWIRRQYSDVHDLRWGFTQVPPWA